MIQIQAVHRAPESAGEAVEHFRLDMSIETGPADEMQQALWRLAGSIPKAVSSADVPGQPGAASSF
jgi:hypothetical protein